MTHATVKTSAPGLCTVAFAYDAEAVAAVKALPGAEYDGAAWKVAVLSLPALKSIFTALTVDPAVLADYHSRLRRMLEDFAAAGLTVRLEGSQVRSECFRKGELGRHLAEIVNTHRAGIAAVLKQGPIVAKVVAPERPPPVIKPEPTPEPETVTDPALEVFLKGVKNAKKKEDRKEAIVKSKRQKKVAERV